MNSKTIVYLFGGNSLIGNAIVEGLEEKYKNSNIDIISIIRSDKQKKLKGKILKVENYIDALSKIKKLDINNIDVNNIFVLSFGVLRSENSSLNLFENIKYHLDINTFQTLNILKSLIADFKYTEIHVVSSILGDFIRPSLFSYSISKNLLNECISKLLTKDTAKSIYVWKPAFVDSELNHGRTATLLKTDVAKIKKIVLRKKSGGVYYVPFYSKYLTNIAKKLSPVVNWIDSKN